MPEKESTVICTQVQELDVGKKHQVEKSIPEHKTDGQAVNPFKPALSSLSGIVVHFAG